jgi:hypothetical protein
MKTFNKHPDWHNQPLRLSQEQKQAPVLAIEDFFECFHLNEVREILWNWMVEIISSPHGISHDNHERNNHLYFYEKIEMLVEAAYIALKKANKQKRRELYMEKQLKTKTS